jgi:aryl-alcohol dehydrogenase-like predicted oxidoreductase
VSAHYLRIFSARYWQLTPGLCSLGKSGLKISKVILGAMSYGDPAWQDWVLKEEEALPLLEHAYKVGINTWDTVYSLAS